MEFFIVVNNVYRTDRKTVDVRYTYDHNYNGWGNCPGGMWLDGFEVTRRGNFNYFGQVDHLHCGTYVTNNDHSHLVYGDEQTFKPPNNNWPRKYTNKCNDGEAIVGLQRGACEGIDCIWLKCKKVNVWKPKYHNIKNEITGSKDCKKSLNPER